MRVIGLDVGTTTLCALVADSATGKILRSVTVPNDANVPGERYEKLQSPMQILRRCTELIRRLRDEFDPVGCIGVTGQMHGILYYDKSGNAVSPLYTWQDGSGNQMHGDTTFAAELSRRTGYKTASGFGSCTYYVHSLLGRVPAGAAGVCTIHDYIAMHLAGEKRPLCHISDAASLGLFDLAALRFDDEAIARAGLRDDLFPRVTADLVPVGTADGVPVCVAIGDNQASFLGSVADMQRSVLVNMGTGGQVSFLSDGSDAGNMELRPMFAGQYICVGASLCGGRAFAMLESFLREAAELVTGQTIESAYGAIDRYLAKHSAPDSPLDVDTRFCGTRADPALRGSIGGVGPGNFTPGHLIYGVLDGIVAELWDMYDSAPHPDHDTMVCSGNGLRKNPALRQAFSRKFGTSAVTPVHTEEAAFGAALCAMTAGGAYDSIYEAQKLIRYTKGE